MGGDPEKHGYGLVQWTPYTKYTEWSPSDPSLMDNNLLRLLYEVENNIQWIATDEYPFSFKEFTESLDSPYNLAIAFIKNYERPADPNHPIRGEQAEEWFSYLGGIMPPIPTYKNSKKWFMSKCKKIIINT